MFWSSGALARHRRLFRQTGERYFAAVKRDKITAPAHKPAQQFDALLRRSFARDAAVIRFR